MDKKRVLIGIVVLLAVLVVGTGCVDYRDSYQEDLEQVQRGYQPIIDPRIIEELKINERARVSINLIDNENISLVTNISKAGNQEKLEIMKGYYGLLIDDVLANLTEKDFELKEKFLFSPAFYGFLSESGLKKLMNDSRVQSIYLDREITMTS